MVRQSVLRPCGRLLVLKCNPEGLSPRLTTVDKGCDHHVRVLREHHRGSLGLNEPLKKI